jgi:hypothetical protein
MHPLCAKATACGRELLELGIRSAYDLHKISVPAVAEYGNRVENSGERLHAPDGHRPPPLPTEGSHPGLRRPLWCVGRTSEGGTVPLVWSVALGVTHGRAALHPSDGNSVAPLLAVCRRVQRAPEESIASSVSGGAHDRGES